MNHNDAETMITGCRLVAFASGVVMKLATPMKSDGRVPSSPTAVGLGFPGIVGNGAAKFALLCPWGLGDGAGTGPFNWFKIFGSKPLY